MGPAGQVSCVAGGGWGFEADVIPAHSPMLSRPGRSIQSQSADSLASWADMPIALAGVARAGKRGPRPRAGRRGKIAISTTEAATPSMSQTLHRPQRTGACQYCSPLVLAAIQRPTHYERVLARWLRAESPRFL